ncbi:pilus assembly protein [Rhodopseudomonas palustris]|uniref:pilus assembly protein n=1 Tax=Rhodopseudomonas palustris TaxID=1076 RepID=UPI002ACE04C5|nr:pilus assembly protein [Rhodopseudomonas palustris]WQH01169.1 pilus assembly protein [Rhodopseudomonas palustris]
MSLTSIAPWSRDVSSRFVKAEGGNVAIIFAIALLPMIGFIGAAIDYSRANKARTSMQAALDSAALMVSKDLSSGVITSGQVSAKANSYFASLYNNTEAPGITVTATYTAKDSTGSSTVLLTGSGDISTEFMRLFGFPTLGIGSSATATWGGTRLRVAMALDVTGSMVQYGSTKLAEMQKAAKTLVDNLRANAKDAEDVYVSIVPFAQMVNVGSANKNASWIKWDYWNSTAFSCSKSRYTSKSTCQKNGGTWAVSSTSTWGGCVTDRDQPADTTKDAPTTTATKFPAADYDACPAQILPMTSAYSASGAQTIKDKIDALQGNGGTNQPIGLHWAWMSLQNGDPLNTPAKDSDYKYTDAIILLSDGMNTIDRWYGNGSSWSKDVDARQKLLCDNIRTASAASETKTVIYTIQVNTDGDPESEILKYCADSGSFFATTTASGISTAFAQIGNSLSKLRIAK